MRTPFSVFLICISSMLLPPLHLMAESEAIEMGPRGVSNFLAHIEKEKKAHVAFLGGSITQNAKGHSKMVADWMNERWPEVEFTFTNAGLSSTCSVSGAFRIKEDVLSKGDVDLLVVEFAVNDDQDAMHDRQTAIRGLEGILRRYFAANPEGDAISVQYVNPGILETIQNGETAVSVEAHKTVARHYGVPIVDVGQALAEEIAAGRMTWEEDYKGTHPNETGYRFASGLITSVVEGSKAAGGPRTIELPDPIDALSYESVYRVSPEEWNWLGGWRYEPVSRDLLPEGAIRDDYTRFRGLRSDSAGDYLYYSFAGKTLGAFILAGPDAGALEVSVDGGDWRKVELFHRFSKSLNYPRSVILADGLSPVYHQIAVRTANSGNGESKGGSATILYFTVNP
jgi:lysophospholipase L1-like esterase